jgi:uncharacterized membrane protein YfcA
MDWFADWSFYLIIYIITTLGATLQGSMGFGLGFVAVPLFAFYDPRFLPGPLILAAVLLTLLLAYREHDSIQFKGMTLVIAGRIAGSLLGAPLLVLIPVDHLSIFFAVMVLIGVGLSVSGFYLALTNRNLFSMGTVSGIMATSSAIGGPPLALIYQRLPGPELRGTLSGIFLIGSSIAIISLALFGRFGWFELKLSVLLFPGILTGFLISRYTAPILDGGYIRTAILIFSFLSGILLIIRAIL